MTPLRVPPGPQEVYDQTGDVGGPAIVADEIG